MQAMGRLIQWCNGATVQQCTVRSNGAMLEKRAVGSNGTVVQRVAMRQGIRLCHGGLWDPTGLKHNNGPWDPTAKWCNNAQRPWNSQPSAWLSRVLQLAPLLHLSVVDWLEGFQGSLLQRQELGLSATG